MKRRTIIAAATIGVVACQQVLAQSPAFPNRTVRIVSAFSAGSGPDAMLRLTAERLSQLWGQQVIIDNRPGGGGFIAIAEAKKANPDGHTLLHVDGLNFTAVPQMYKKVPYERGDLEPLSPIHRSYFFIAVAAGSPLKSFADLVSAAKAKPGEVTYGSWQIGSVAHLGGAALETATGTQMNHIAFRDNGQLYTSVANGDVVWAFGSAGSTGALQRSGKLRYLALAGPQRLSTHPSVPTVTEAGGPAGFEASGWVGLFAPRGLPSATADKIVADLGKALSDQDIRAKMIEFGYEAVPMSPGQTAKLIAAETPRYGEVIKRSAITLD